MYIIYYYFSVTCFFFFYLRSSYSSAIPQIDWTAIVQGQEMMIFLLGQVHFFFFRFQVYKFPVTDETRIKKLWYYREHVPHIIFLLIATKLLDKFPWRFRLFSPFEQILEITKYKVTGSDLFPLTGLVGVTLAKLIWGFLIDL